MTRDEYERRIQRLEAELRAGIELLETAHRHQLRALHLVWAATGGEGVEIPPPVVVATAATVPAQAAPVLPAPPPQPVRRGAWDLYNHVVEALAVVPEVFDRNDVCRALGYEPDRGSLYRTFLELKGEGVIAVQQRGAGKWPTRYRKTGVSSATSGD
jgi:hypothetical protein